MLGLIQRIRQEWASLHLWEDVQMPRIFLRSYTIESYFISLLLVLAGDGSRRKVLNVTLTWI